MRWMRCRWVSIALLTAVVVVLGLEAAAVASPARRGATYQGSGGQPHFSSGRFVLQFRVARNGRQIRELNVPYLSAYCSRTGTVLGMSPRVAAPARIRSDGTFHVDVKLAPGGLAGTTVEVTGRFLSHGRALGTLRYRGQGGYRDCKVDATWTAHVKPPAPRVRRFTGTTDQGTRVTFERTIERQPRVMRFTFGRLRTTFSDGGPCGSVEIATGSGPWWDAFALPVKHGRFSGLYGHGLGPTVISGRFDAKDRASGTVSYADRTCATGKVHWTARPTGSVRAMGAMRNRAKRSATYQGTGRQPNWPHGYFPGSGAFSLQFRIAGDGRHATGIWVWNLSAFCGRRDRYPALPGPALGSATIRPDGTFQVDLKPTESGALSTIRVSGRFLAHGRATGTLRYHGRYSYSPTRCNADGTWTASVKPSPPPVQQLTGTTSQGTRVTFQRTIERQPHVLRFNFGSLHTYLAGSPPTSCGKVTVATGALLQPGPPVQFSLTVNRGRFSGHYFYEAYDIHITGRFDAKGQATGTVNYGDRGDCITGTVRWTAHLVARRTSGSG